MSLTFTLGKIVNLGAAASGELGTALLFKGSFSYEAPAAWVDEKFLADMAARNRRRAIIQKSGLSLIMLSFTLAGIAQFLD